MNRYMTYVPSHLPLCALQTLIINHSTLFFRPGNGLRRPYKIVIQATTTNWFVVQRLLYLIILWITSGGQKYQFRPSEKQPTPEKTYKGFTGGNAYEDKGGLGRGAIVAGSVFRLQCTFDTCGRTEGRKDWVGRTSDCVQFWGSLMGWVSFLPPLPAQSGGL